MRFIFISAATLALSFSATASSSAPIDPFTELFANSCMKHFHAQDEMRAKMSDATVLEGKPAAFFLGKSTGTAWSLELGGRKYVVALRNDNVCAVFAQTAPVAEVQANFETLVATAPAPLVADRRDGAGPNGGSVRTVAYAWYRPENKSELLFTLTTSSDAAPTVQAMASMALVGKADAPAGKAP